MIIVSSYFIGSRWKVKTKIVFRICLFFSMIFSFAMDVSSAQVLDGIEGIVG